MKLIEDLWYFDHLSPRLERNVIKATRNASQLMLRFLSLKLRLFKFSILI